MFNKAIIAWGQSATRTLLLQLLPPLVVGVPLWCVQLTVIANLAFSDSSDLFTLFGTALILTPVLFLLGVGGWIVLVTAGSMVWNHRAFERQTETVESICTALGLTLGGSSRDARYYSGAVNHQPATIVLSAGSTLSIHVKASLRAYVSVVEKDALLRFAVRTFHNQRPIAVSSSELSRFDVFGTDSQWARALLSRPDISPVILRLLSKSGSTESRQVRLTPNRASLKMERTSSAALTESNLRQWLNDLMMVARAAETLLPPEINVEAAQTDDESQIDSWVNSAPLTAASLSVSVLSAILPVIFTCGLLYLLAFMFIAAWVNWLVKQLGLLG